jgi:hypothetical protein
LAQAARTISLLWGETYHALGESIAVLKNNIMGDKSPKSNQKKSSQKQSKASTAEQKKKQAAFAKQSAGKKK